MPHTAGGTVPAFRRAVPYAAALILAECAAVSRLIGVRQREEYIHPTVELWTGSMPDGLARQVKSRFTPASPSRCSHALALGLQR